MDGRSCDSLHIVVWGTYDIGKPRTRILLQGLEQNGVEVTCCHKDVWGGIEDKSGIAGWGKRAVLALRWLAGYPGLVARYLRLARHDIVLIGYMGYLDVLVLWPFARLRGVPVVWDAFLSLYNTVVEDRKLIGRRNPLAYWLFAWEWLACRAATLVVLDTEAHARYFRRCFGLRQEHTAAVMVGAETQLFHPDPDGSQAPERSTAGASILFYGQFIPLHGIETIIRAAGRLEGHPFEWRLVGRGQEAGRIREMLERHSLEKLSWTPWVAYEELPGWIHNADICLGIFGATAKADMVIPNKVFQILAMGKPLITRDSAAIRELLDPAAPGVYLVPAADPDALAEAVLRCHREYDPASAAPARRRLCARIEPLAIGRRFLELAYPLAAPRAGARL